MGIGVGWVVQGERVFETHACPAEKNHCTSKVKHSRGECSGKAEKKQRPQDSTPKNFLRRQHGSDDGDDDDTGAVVDLSITMILSTVNRSFKPHHSVSITPL